MNAIEELGEVIKIVDKGERVLAFAGWVARWVEVGFVQNDFDLKLAELADRSSGPKGPAVRAAHDLAALEALIRHMIKARPEPFDLVELEDQGIVALKDASGRPFKAYRSRMKLTILLSKPHAAEPKPEGLVVS